MIVNSDSEVPRARKGVVVCCVCASRRGRGAPSGLGPGTEKPPLKLRLISLSLFSALENVNVNGSRMSDLGLLDWGLNWLGLGNGGRKVLRRGSCDDGGSY